MVVNPLYCWMFDMNSDTGYQIESANPMTNVRLELFGPPISTELTEVEVGRKLQFIKEHGGSLTREEVVGSTLCDVYEVVSRYVTLSLYSRKDSGLPLQMSLVWDKGWNKEFMIIDYEV